MAQQSLLRIYYTSSRRRLDVPPRTRRIYRVVKVSNKRKVRWCLLVEQPALRVGQRCHSNAAVGETRAGECERSNVDKECFARQGCILACCEALAAECRQIDLALRHANVEGLVLWNEYVHESLSWHCQVAAGIVCQCCERSRDTRSGRGRRHLGTKRPTF